MKLVGMRGNNITIAPNMSVRELLEISKRSNRQDYVGLFNNVSARDLLKLRPQKPLIIEDGRLSRIANNSKR